MGGASYLGGDFERCLDIPPYMFGEDQLRSEQRDTQKLYIPQMTSNNSNNNNNNNK